MWKRTGEGLQTQSEGGEGRISPESSAGQASGGGLLAPPSGALGTVVVVVVGRVQKEKLCPTKRSLLSWAPQGQLLLEEAAESQGRQRRTSPDPCQGEGRVWAFTRPPTPQRPVFGQNLGATELLD